MILYEMYQGRLSYVVGPIRTFDEQSAFDLAGWAEAPAAISEDPVVYVDFTRTRRMRCLTQFKRES